jgi:uncharacterized protein YqeY
MKLEEKINIELKAAMKAGDKTRLNTLRSLRAAIIEFAKSGKGEMQEADEQKILNTQAKRRRDAIDLYEKGGRQELADKEQAELEVIQEFLPKQLGDEEIEEVLKGIIASVGADSMRDMGKVMGAAMKELSGKADGNKVQQLVKNLLG